MTNEYIIAILGFIIFILFLFFAGFLLTVKTNKKLSNILLASFLIITAIDISAFFYTVILDVNLTIDMLRNKVSDLKNPLVFLYILSVIYSNFKLKKIHLLHLLPWIISLIVLTPNFFLVDYNLKIEFSNNYTNNPEILFLKKFSLLISLFYLFAEVYYVKRYRKLLLENHTNKNHFKNYSWLKQLLILMFFGTVLTVIKGYVRDNQYPDQIIATWRIITLTFGIFFVFWLIFKALNSPSLFRGIDVNLSTSKEMKLKNLRATNNQQIIDLKEYMQAEKPYLNPSLTIKKLATQLNMPMRDLSVLINQDLNQHFFDFVNEYRIKNAQDILKDASKNKLTILEILYEVGFNSKSSFNTAFKKYTGKTPTQYRKSL